MLCCTVLSVQSRVVKIMGSFALDLSKFSNLTEEKLRIVAVKSFLGLDTDVINDSPVKEGRLRNNWFPAINKFSDETTEEADKSGAKAIARAEREFNKFKLGDTMTLTNNLPYARRIEFEGWSKKAPAGMVRINVTRWQQHLDTQARKLK